MLHKSRRTAAPVECPLASLGHNSPSSDHHPAYHHPLSSSPLNPSVYQSRISPLLNVNADGIVQYSSADDASTAAGRQLQPTVGDLIGTGSSIDNVDYVNCNASYRHQIQCYASGLSSDGGGSGGGGASMRAKTKSDRIDSAKELNAIDYAIDSNSSLDECYGRPQARNKSSPIIDHSQKAERFLENKMRTLFMRDNANDYKNKFPFVNSERYYLQGNRDNRADNPSSQYIRRPSSPSETSESERYLIGRTSRGSPTPPPIGCANYDFLVNHQRTSSANSGKHSEHLNRFSPSFDQGYATLVSPSPSGGHSSGGGCTVIAQTITQLRNRNRTETAFGKLNDELCAKLFAWLDSRDLCTLSRVCKRFDSLVWQPQLWKAITLKGELIP